MSSAALKRFMALKAGALRGRARRLIALTPDTVGLRGEDRMYAPSPAHFAAANRRLAAIDRHVRERLRQLKAVPASAPTTQRLEAMAMVEREVDRARRTFALFFELFAQRGTAFGPALAAHDAMARDCYAAIRQAVPRIFTSPLLSPITYMEHGYSPATMRRGVTLSRLLGESNPFPLIRIPYDRDQPWQAVFLHEVAHNLQADLGLWEENKQAVLARLASMRFPLPVIDTFTRWHKEIWADLAAVRLGGPAVAWGLAEFLSHPPDKVMTYRPGGAHPTGYFRVPLLAGLIRRMGYTEHAGRLDSIWASLYKPSDGHRIPQFLLDHAPRAIPAVIDEIVYQPRRALAERVLASLIPYTQRDETRIRQGAQALLAGRVPADLPPRFLCSACRYALDQGADAARMANQVTERLAIRRAATAQARGPVELFPVRNAA